MLQILFGSILVSNPLIAEAASTPTLKCTRIGQRIIWRKEKYICVRSGSQLTWAKESTKPSPAPSVTVTPRSTTTAASSSNSYTPPPGEFGVAKSSDLKLSQPLSVSNPSFVNPSRGYILVRRESGVIAFSNNCTHLGREVEVSGTQLICYAHGSYFDAVTGRPIQGPATRNLTVLPVIERDGTIFVVDTL